MLTDTFLKIVSQYTTDSNLANDLWLEIFTKYSEPKRYYHNITHLDNMMTDIIAVKDSLTDWETIFFAVCYHDIVYKAKNNTNEEDSCKIAKQRLQTVNYPIEKILLCAEMILATKSHQLSADNDTNYLIDADMSILGKSPDEYQQYTYNIRKEFSAYPEFMYKSGRKKVLQTFLVKGTIYKTEYFINMYEKQARTNIINELEGLAK